MVAFIYTPQSGSRLVAARPTDRVVLLRWRNGSYHVVGGRRLTWETARPGRHWRESARQLISRLVEDLGGVAWDAQGQVNLVAPDGCTGVAERLMRALRRVTVDVAWDEDEDSANQAACLIDGTARINSESRRVQTAFPPPRPPDIRHPTALVRLVDGSWLVDVGNEQVKAPEAWGPPAIEGAWTTLDDDGASDDVQVVRVYQNVEDESL